MTDQFRAVVIGGGIVGCGTLYHLTRLGWTDSLLVEKTELTSGSTWHAAGNVTFFGHYPSITRLYVESLASYLAAQKESEISIGFHKAGSLRLATTSEEMEAFAKLEPIYKDMNINYRIVDSNEVSQLHPLLTTDDLLGAAHTPDDGHVDASGATHALAKAARNRGAEIRCRTRVERIEPLSDGRWRIELTDSVVLAEHVIIANSYWAREMLSPLDINVPVIPLEHHELITESIPEIEQLDFELPVIRDPVAPANFRQEGNGILCGIYESEPVPWGVGGIPRDYEGELLPNNTEILEPHVPKVCERIPVFGEAGLKTVFNGLICYTPDGCPLLGPVTNFPGLWLATGFCVGIGTGGGSGNFLVKWIVDGEPPYDLPAVLPDRFSQSLTSEEIVDAIIETYAEGYTIPVLPVS